MLSNSDLTGSGQKFLKQWSEQMAGIILDRAREELKRVKENTNRSGSAETFGDRVAALRKRLGLSQSEFAQKYNISIANIRNWEQKRHSKAPDQAATVLVEMIEKRPHEVAQIISETKRQFA
jgi:putative transcriptional regulator